MRRNNEFPLSAFAGRPLLALGLMAAALLAPACAGAQEAPSTGGETIGRVFDALGLRSEPKPAPDFIQKARPDPQSLDYQPFSPPDSERARAKTPAQLDAMGADLNRSLARNRAAAARVKIPDTGAAAKIHPPK
jgi:hypothetical protein